MRKTDRRTTYTINVIKEAFLELIRKVGYQKLTVTALCKQAEITRSTFYLHFDSLEEVLEATLADALSLEEIQQISPAAIFNNLQTTGELNEALMPACQRIVDLPQYKALFLDANITQHILSILFEYNKSNMVTYLVNETKLNQALSEKLFLFLLYGSFFTNKSLHWNKDNEWYQTQKTILTFIQGGLEAVKKC